MMKSIEKIISHGKNLIIWSLGNSSTAFDVAAGEVVSDYLPTNDKFTITFVIFVRLAPFQMIGGVALPTFCELLIKYEKETNSYWLLDNKNIESDISPCSVYKQLFFYLSVKHSQFSRSAQGG